MFKKYFPPYDTTLDPNQTYVFMKSQGQLCTAWAELLTTSERGGSDN